MSQFKLMRAPTSIASRVKKKADLKVLNTVNQLKNNDWTKRKSKTMFFDELKPPSASKTGMLSIVESLNSTGQ